MLPPVDCIEFLRGRKNRDTDFGEGFDHALFYSDFGPISELPGWEGTSVNWDLSCGGALEQLFAELAKDGTPKFKEGAIRIPRDVLDRLIKRYGSNNLAYELREENGNIYHGHILVSTLLQSKRKLMLCGVIVDAFTEIHLRE